MNSSIFPAAADRGQVSVCMAAYNGAAHIEEQVASILPQLAHGDELVIVDDASTDDTAKILEALEDPRIRVIRSAVNRGYVRTFEAALAASTGEYVFLSDQDDVWLPGRVDAMVAELGHADVVASNFGYFGQKPRRIESLRLRSADSGRRWANLLMLWIGVRPYYGCAMAFRGEVRNLILPFPAFLTETHDQWIALVGNLRGSMAHLEANTLDRRLHDNNTTPKKARSLLLILRSRIMLVRAFAVALTRMRRLRSVPRP
ncbi:glycosyltransferase [Arthrobacter sp. zg-Y877]|uniref:glycosyltransferase n=1 Tax=Arthrobacter sp. zg-Y877 TaxID=3049074 RepID=UPI0025A3C980|nr:glycosyltransferase [Arthrobacter sp. zg-Y877]MDM7989804.1 glycosyltransferase [Arthrobacter sp. zg-Y877]